ncbi:hypothetical protein [Dyadobacter luteus]|uniref:hypothetical protein n=1 Tax=Dyadobacter luteus TaxID=2259619 RepID=UPI001314BC07|nr:hypothetical protein [Dyadobacter luteus]
MERKIAEKSAPSVKKTLDNSLPDLSQHPVVVKKVTAAKEFLKKHPIPEHLLRK